MDPGHSVQAWVFGGFRTPVVLGPVSLGNGARHVLEGDLRGLAELFRVVRSRMKPCMIPQDSNGLSGRINDHGLGFRV